jgi:hypothetical protein
MNETLENIMIFINENTNILIGICLFLIFVLVAYLIDNSVKSKKIMKEMKEKEEKAKEGNEEIPVMPINYNINNNVQNEKFEEAVENNDNKIEVKAEETVKEEPVSNNAFVDAISNSASNIEVESEEVPVNNVPTNDVFEDAVRNNDNVNENKNDDLTNIIASLNKETTTIDNSEVKEAKAEVVYKNDKKLSDILLGGLSNETPKEDFNDIKENNIFDSNNNSSADVVPKEVESKVEIELDQNELDNIMKKLNNGSAMGDDNYTNIF